MRYYQIATVCLLAISVTSCSERQKHKDEKIAEIPTVNVTRRDLVLEHAYVSNIEAIRNVEVRSKVSGFLEGIFVDEGQTVKKGQILFRIGDAEYKNEVSKARAALGIAQANKKTSEVEYSRVKSLVSKKIVSATELDLALAKLKASKSKIEEAQSDLEIALHKLSYTVIRAPFDGIVDRIPLKNGSLINEGTLITSVSDISSMYAYFSISENEYLNYKRGLNASASGNDKTVCLVLSDGKDYDCKGEIETVVGEFEASTGSIAFRARFPNPQQLLKHNATGKVKLTSTLKHALLIPQKSAFEIQDKNYVFVIDSNNVAHMKSFVPAGRAQQFYIIKSGLDAGDVIAYEGIQNIKDGMTVAPRKATNPNATLATSL